MKKVIKINTIEEFINVFGDPNLHNKFGGIPIDYNRLLADKNVVRVNIKKARTKRRRKATFIEE